MSAVYPRNDVFEVVRFYSPSSDTRGQAPAAGAAYADAARLAADVAERDHLVRQAARARAAVSLRSSA